MTFHILTKSSPLWQKLADFAATCGWVGGEELYEKMLHGEWLAWERVFLACKDGKPVGFCVLTNQDGYPQLPYSPYISELFVDPLYRGNRIGKDLLATAEQYAAEAGFPQVYLMTDLVSFYEKYGYTAFDSAPSPLDEAVTEVFYRKTVKAPEAVQ